MWMAAERDETAELDLPARHRYWKPIPHSCNLFTIKLKWNLTIFLAQLWCPVFTVTVSLSPGRGFRGKIKNQWRSVLSVLIRQSTLRFLATGDVSMRWLAHRALTRLCLQQSVCKPHRQSARARAQTDQFTQLQLSLKPFHLSSNWT